jgi:hypothetical protein
MSTSGGSSSPPGSASFSSRARALYHRLHTLGGGRVGRDMKAVHGDVQALIKAGVIHKEGRGIVFPYDAVHVDFMLTRAA